MTVSHFSNRGSHIVIIYTLSRPPVGELKSFSYAVAYSGARLWPGRQACSSFLITPANHRPIVALCRAGARLAPPTDCDMKHSPDQRHAACMCIGKRAHYTHKFAAFALDFYRSVYIFIYTLWFTKKLGLFLTVFTTASGMRCKCKCKM